MKTLTQLLEQTQEHTCASCEHFKKEHGQNECLIESKVLKVYDETHLDNWLSYPDSVNQCKFFITESALDSEGSDISETAADSPGGDTSGNVLLPNDKSELQELRKSKDPDDREPKRGDVKALSTQKIACYGCDGAGTDEEGDVCPICNGKGFFTETKKIKGLTHVRAIPSKKELKRSGAFDTKKSVKKESDDSKFWKKCKRCHQLRTLNKEGLCHQCFQDDLDAERERDNEVQEGYSDENPDKCFQCHQPLDQDERCEGCKRAPEQCKCTPLETGAEDMQEFKSIIQEVSQTNNKGKTSTSKVIGKVTIDGKTYELGQAPYESEMDMGEGGKLAQWLLLQGGKQIGKLVKWHPQSNGVEYGLFIGNYPGKIDRTELKGNQVKIMKETDMKKEGLTKVQKQLNKGTKPARFDQFKKKESEELWYVFNQGGERKIGPFKTEKEADDRLAKILKQFPGEETAGFYISTKPRVQEENIEETACNCGPNCHCVKGKCKCDSKKVNEQKQRKSYCGECNDGIDASGCLCWCQR